MNITDKERIIMGLKSKLVEDDQMNVHVVSRAPDGTEVSMGSVTKEMWHINPEHAKKMVGRIRFPPLKRN